MKETFNGWGEPIKNTIENSPEDERLIEQLHQPERLHFGEDELTIYDVNPEANKQKSEVPVVFGAGLLQDGEKQRELMFQTAKRGRRALSFTTKHGIEEHGLDPERTEGMSEAEIRKMAALLATINEKGIEKTDYVGHSEGGVYGLMAATAFPERFRSVIIDSPIVISKDDTPFKLIKRFTTDLAMNVIDDMKPNKPDWVEKIGNKPGVAGDIYDTPWSRSIQDMRARTGTDRQASLKPQKLSARKLWEEVNAIANTKFEELLPRLKAQGVNVVVSYGVDDKTTPGERVQNAVKADDVDGVYSMRGSHSSMYWAPQKYAELIDHTLSALEKK